MTTLSPDTSLEFEGLQIERLRQMPAWRKMALVGEVNQTVRTPALGGLRQRHPDDSPDQRRPRLAGMLFGPELAAKVYGPIAKDQGEY